MKLPECPTEAAIRKALIVRADAFCRLTGISPTALCRGALKGDSGFLRRVKAGENFTIGNYTRINNQIDKLLEIHVEKARSFLKAAER